MSIQTNFRAIDMLGGPKSAAVTQKAAPAPKAKNAASAPVAPKVEEPVAVVEEAPVV